MVSSIPKRSANFDTLVIIQTATVTKKLHATENYICSNQVNQSSPVNLVMLIPSRMRTYWMTHALNVPVYIKIQVGEPQYKIFIDEFYFIMPPTLNQVHQIRTLKQTVWFHIDDMMITYRVTIPDKYYDFIILAADHKSNHSTILTH